MGGPRGEVQGLGRDGEIAGREVALEAHDVVLLELEPWKDSRVGVVESKR